MRSALRTALALLLIFPLVEMPARAAASQPLGFVLLAQASQLDRSIAANGTNVYAGDTLVTSQAGSLRMGFGANQVYLLSSSVAALAGDSSGVIASLTQGTAGFVSSRAPSVALRALGVLVRPKTADPTHGRVSVAGPASLLVTSYHGALELMLDGQTYTIPGGSSYRVEIQGTSQDAGAHPPVRRRKIILVLVGAAAMAYGGGAIYHELTESPDKP